MVASRFITDGRTRLHYVVYGRGPRVLLAFHGYGQGHGHWRGIVAALGEARVSVYAFDLFYHGQSRLAKADAPLTKKPTRRATTGVSGR